MNKIIGGVLLIIGTSIGGGMLALPVATASSGFWPATVLLFGCWLLMTFGAFLILEVSLSLPKNNNMISMAQTTTGALGKWVAWITYLLLLYSLLSAYISGGTDVLHGLLIAAKINTPDWLDSLSFVIIMGFIVYLGIRTVDYVNRGLMTAKFIAYFILVLLVAPHISLPNLALGHSKYILSAMTVAITSFGYATIIPSLRTYLDGDVKKLRLIVMIGSFIPLVCYIAWIAVVLGALPHQGPHGLLNIMSSQDPVSELTQALILQLNTETITIIARFFTSICVLTSFLGVSLCLSDFLADGLNIPKRGFGNTIIYGLTFIPPLAIVLVDPSIFIISLSYAGIFCIILLTLLPAWMAWRGRYKTQTITGYQVAGGRLALLLIIVVSFTIISYTLLQDFHLI